MTLSDAHPCGRRNLYFGTYCKYLEVYSAIKVMHVMKILCVTLLGFLPKIHQRHARTSNVCMEKTIYIRVMPAMLLPKKRRKSSLNAYSV